MRPGFSRRSSSGPRPQRSSVSGFEILDQDVALQRQATHQGAALVLAQIDRDALLVARQRMPPARRVAVHHPPAADGVARVGRLDLDHLGAVVGEQRGGEGAGEDMPQLEDLEAVEGARSGGVSRRISRFVHRRRVCFLGRDLSSDYDGCVSPPLARIAPPCRASPSRYSASTSRQGTSPARFKSRASTTMRGSASAGESAARCS